MEDYMIITDNAKKIMLDVLEEDKKNVIRIEIIKQGCHGQLYLDTIISNDFELINDVPVQISNDDRDYLDNVIFDTQNGNLTFRLANVTGCGSCGGCDDDNGCEGCH